MANLLIRLLALAALAGLAFLPAACSQEKVEIKNTVTAYNKMLAEALAKPDPRIMEYLTTRSEFDRIASYIIFLKKDKKVLVSELKSLEFLEVTVLETGGKRTSVVRTKEMWSFHYVDEKTRKRITDERDIGYENTYHLVRRESRWVVDRVDALEKPPGGTG